MATSKNPQAVFPPGSDVYDVPIIITFEDQQKINRFARLNAKLEDYKEEIKIKQNSIKNLDDASDELALLDDAVKIPYQFGEVFVAHNLEKTQHCLEAAKEKKQAEITELDKKCASLKSVMSELKTQLYAKFGDHINLEADDN
ncbi:prefoldin subunit 4 [Orussus abietinus]|uniref:prefoldin subunit 4 n=1 Tax=Orussus abietinus TaxID=222816 RepID=UPI000625F10D|nr:prefoldin subunit 4 [Orussus abietinus]